MPELPAIDNILEEFLADTNENMAQLDLDLVTLEKSPDDREILGRVFRLVHSIKGSAGFLGFHRLTGLVHAGESLLQGLRSGKRKLNPPMLAALFEMVDGIRRVIQ